MTFYRLLPLLLTCQLTVQAEVPAPNDFTQQPQVPYLSPEEFLKTVQLPEGYSLELVLSEPQIKEPVAIAFDPNGAMYIAEMRTYMQNIDGTDEITPNSVVSKHVSTKNDGVFDKHSIYLDKVLLPRMILPLDDRILLGITNTSDLSIHRDSNGDGIADESKPWFVGGPRGGNMEHQPSGLVWGMDNWIYSTYNAYRLRWHGENKAPLQESTPGNGGQWGLAQDNYGKMWWSNAGGEKGFWNYQTPIIYGAINVPSQKEPDFDMPWPLVGVRDYQGGTGKSRDDGTLNHFTGSCGQTIFRGDRLPTDMSGNAFLCEPVGRLIRRAIVHDSDGVTQLTNAHPKSEFLRSSDLCFRPLNTTTGPDGCLYIVDMYRGIIQEGNWVSNGSYLRKVVQQYGFQNNTGRGRIWRLVHKDFKPGPQPNMLAETPAQWVKHLTHPNGWWRDTAQRLLILKGDHSCVPALTEMLHSAPNHLARIHALWTLEGLDSLTPVLARDAMLDKDQLVRVQAIRASETLLKAGDTSFITDIKKASTDPDVHVKIQSLLTGKLHKFPQWKEDASALIASTTSAGIKELGNQLLSVGPTISKSFSPAQRKQLEQGMKIYQEVCFACHGADGRGTPILGTKGATLAPPLAGSRTVKQNDAMIRVLLNGLEGPINGKTYESQMIPQNSNSDQWIADIVSYVRNSFDNSGEIIDAKKVKQLRKELSSRTKPWTIAELQALTPQPLENRKDWKLTASHQGSKLALCIDGKSATRWDTGVPQSKGMWLQIELPAVTELSGVELNCDASPNDFPREYEVMISADGASWSKAIAKGEGTQGLTSIAFDATINTKFLRINQLGQAPGKYWSIHELHLMKPIKK